MWLPTAFRKTIENHGRVNIVGQKVGCLFRVLFRERGILSFFHVGKMTTHRAKIPRFCCGYFRPCVPLLGPGGPVFNVSGWRGSAGDGVV